MKVIKFEPHGFGSNSYILTADNKNAVVIDSSEISVLNALKQHNLDCKHVLLTHGHFDHVGGCGAFCESGARIYCGEMEKEFIFSKEYLGIFGGVYVPKFEIAETFKDGETFELCGMCFKAIHTPGHTAGSVCYIVGDCLFTGDTLFRGSIGRCDLPTGNVAQLLNSLKKLASLDGDYKVYCGHGENTTLAYERLHNPYLR